MDIDPTDSVDLEALKARMEAFKAAADPATAEYVDATLQYGMENVRAEYTGFARFNRSAFDRFARRVTFLLAGLAAIQLILGISAVKLTVSNSDRTNENHALIAKQAAARKNSILLSCREGNERHETAKVFVATLVAKNPKAQQPKTPAQKKLATEQIALFVEAIAPKYDCAARLAKFSRP